MVGEEYTEETAVELVEQAGGEVIEKVVCFLTGSLGIRKLGVLDFLANKGYQIFFRKEKKKHGRNAKKRR